MAKKTGISAAVRNMLPPHTRPMLAEEIHARLAGDIDCSLHSVKLALSFLKRDGEAVSHRNSLGQGARARYSRPNPKASRPQPAAPRARGRVTGRPEKSEGGRGKKPRYILYDDGSLEIHRPERVVELAADEAVDLARFLRFTE